MPERLEFNDLFEDLELNRCPDGWRGFGLEPCVDPFVVICWDGTRFPDATMCPTSPGGVECPDGSWAELFGLCPDTPEEIVCWDGTRAPAETMCPTSPGGVECPDGSRAELFGLCPDIPEEIVCWDGTRAPAETMCPTSPGGVECPDGSRAELFGLCPDIPEEIVCWDGTRAPAETMCPMEESAIGQANEWINAFSRGANEEFDDCTERSEDYCLNQGRNCTDEGRREIPCSIAERHCFLNIQKRCSTSQ